MLISKLLLIGSQILKLLIMCKLVLYLSHSACHLTIRMCLTWLKNLLIKQLKMGNFNNAPFNITTLKSCTDSVRVSKDSLSVVKFGKSQLVRVTSDQLRSLRPSAYKYLLP